MSCLYDRGRQASFRLEALPCGQAELNLTFQLPPASEVVPPPAQVYPTHVPQRPIQPLFPEGCFPKKSDYGAKLKNCFSKEAAEKLSALSAPPSCSGYVFPSSP